MIEPEHVPGPDVRTILSLPEVAAGEPELIAGARGLERSVRWAHVVAGVAAAALLDGGELILTTGAGWPHEPEALGSLAETLAETGVAGVILELGPNFSEPPAPLVESCERHEIPLIALHREVRFVQITQRVHQQILATQNEALEARAEVHAMLTELGLNRSPVDYVVERLADTLDAPVVLEDPGHRVVAWAGEGHQPDDVLSAWANAGGSEFPLPAGWVRVPVEARGTRWGQLFALPGDPHPAGRRTVLELGAFALALGRLADTGPDQWLRHNSKQLFDTLLTGRYRSDTELATQLAASGLPVDGRVLFGATLRGAGDFGAHGTLERAILETALRRAAAPEGRVLIAQEDAPPEANGEHLLLTLLSFPPDDPRAGSSLDAVPPLAQRLAHELDMLLPSTTPDVWRAHLSLGVAGRSLRSLIASLERVQAAGRLPANARSGRVTVQLAERQPLAYLVRGLSGLPEVQQFASEAFEPLVAHDRERGTPGDLVHVLEAYTAHPTNRSLAAQRARLSRSVFYQRLALIEDLLDVELAAGETIAMLTVALLARDPGRSRSISRA
ncbi:MAG: PucR family transcriptional regulator [Leucobacter sp.]